MIYVGIDLHRKRSHVTALAEDGRELLSRKVGNEPEALRVHVLTPQAAPRATGYGSPLVRDSVRGFRTGRLERVLAGDFDVIGRAG